MYSKTMAQAVNEEPVEFQDTLVAPECDSCALRVAGFLENRFENLAPDNKEEASLETLPDISGIETCGANDVVTDPEDFPEKVMPLEEEGQICGLQAENTTAVPSFSIIQAQCKSEEDDGYCSRSSLDSPVQTSQSDSEANDPEVFALKETSTTSQSSPTDGPGTTQAPIEAFADCPGSLMSTASVSATTRGAVPAPTGVLSPYASHSAGPQKILIVNKTANVKYLIPTTGEVKSAGTSKTLSIPSVNPGPPPASPQLPNLVNLKILKPGLNKFCPGQITLLRVPDKETPGLSSVTVTRPLLKQPSSARTSPRTSSFIAVTGSQRDPNSQVTGGPVLALEKEMGHPAILQRTVCADAPFSLKYSAESSTSAKNDRTSTRLTADSLDEYGCLGNVECRSEATSGSSAVGQRSSASTYSLSPGGDAVSTVSYKAEASACLQAGGGGDALQPHPEGSSAQAVGNDADKSQLNAQPADDVIAAGAAQDCTISSLTDVRRNNHETVPRNAVIGSVGSLNRNGAQRPAVGCLQGRPPVEGISCHAISRSQVVVAAAGRDTGVLSVPKVDKFKKPFPMASFPLSAARMQDQVSATKASATSRAGPTAKSAAGENDSQKILTACLSSTSFVNEGSHAGSVAKLAINGQTGVTNKSSVYQLGGRNNQDVTVILLPQTSLHSIPKKTNPVNETTCKQVVLRIGPSQVFKAVSVNTDSLRTQPVKSDEKLGKAFGSEGSNGRDSAWLDAVSKKELAAESLSKTSQLNLALNKTTNVMAVVERAAASSKDAMSAAKQLPNPEKEILSLPKSSTSIGHFASLSLSSLQVASASGATDSSQRLTGGKQLPSSPASSKAGTTAVTTQFKGQKTVVQTGNVRGRANDVSNTGRNRISRQGLHTIRKSCQSVGYLHPLIDHDYCEFSAFCADVQSSIISLTDSSIRPERRYVKKNRAARTKAMRVSQYVSENCSTENRPKRKYCKRKQVLEAETGKKHGALNSKIKASGKVVASPSKGSASTGKDSIQSLTTSSDDKDYVKIPGHYQDEYVYYATKRLPGRPRNRADASNKASDVVVSKPPTTAAAGISMFDWYKEMAQTDKTSRFGAAEIADCSARGSYLEEPSTGKDCTPVDESDVADLVMDMLPSGDLVQPISDDMKFMSSSGIVDSLLSNPLDMGMLATSGGESSGDVGSTYLNLMAEEVRLMLSSMGEAELKLLESHLENEKITEEMHTDGLDINSYLGDYASHEANMSQSSVSNLLDVDDINDGDLLSADIANMNIILNDLNATNRAQATHDSTTAKLEAGGIGSIFDKGVNSCDDFMGGIHDIGLSFTSDAQAVNTSNPNKSFQRPDQFRSLSLIPCSDGAESSMPLLCDASPPELTTINMFWNDLPGLLMNGKEFVRLVDIHKQIMPAKDTGILKKRCHMMGLHITNCTELQRDFLIRYMNAAKSKSTVIIAKDAAIMLIGFYVNPKSRSKGADDFELDMLMPPTKLTKPSAPHASRHQWSVASKLKQTGFPAAGSEPSAGSLSAGSDAGVTTAPEKHICRTTIPQPTREGTSTGNSNDFGLETGADVKRSERLRHKHICYADLIHGGIDDSDRRSGKLEGVQSTSAYDNTLADEDRSDFNTKGFSSSLSDSEQAELENLIREQKRRRLTLEEKLRLKLLRNCQKRSASIPSSKVELALKGTRRRLLKRAKRTRRLLVWKRNRKLPSTAGDLHTLEHCYAASPAQLTGGMSKHQNSADHHNPKSSEHHVTRNSHASASTSDSFTPSAPMSLTPKVVTSATKSTTVGVIHRDVTCRVNRRRRSQIGELVIHLYTSNDSPCIRCSNCREMLSVQQFLKHMHWRRGSDKLVRVTIAQKLHLQSSSRTPDNLAAWDEFQKKRGRFEGMPEAHHTETTSSFVAHRTPVATKEPSVIEDTAKMVHHPSTRHSSRVSKRKLLHPVEKYVFANTNAQSDASVILPSPDAKRRRLTTDVDDHRSSAVVGQQHVSTPTVNHSKFPQRQKSNLPSASREKGKAKRRSVVPSDRLLRVTTRRAQDSRPTSASTLD